MITPRVTTPSARRKRAGRTDLAGYALVARCYLGGFALIDTLAEIVGGG
jgi:hypothetical protein